MEPLKMGKVTVLKINADMTFTEKTRKTEKNSVKMSKTQSPSFSVGKSVFKEEEHRWWQFWKKRRNLLLWLDGAGKCFELASPKKIEPNFWTDEEKEKFIAKTVAKSKSEQKPFSTAQFFLLVALGIGVILLQIISMRGVRFG